MNMIEPKIARKMEESWKLRDRAVELLDLVVTEWKTDLTSVACFDLRIVNEAKEIINRLEILKKELGEDW